MRHTVGSGCHGEGGGFFTNIPTLFSLQFSMLLDVFNASVMTGGGAVSALVWCGTHGGEWMPW